MITQDLRIEPAVLNIADDESLVAQVFAPLNDVVDFYDGPDVFDATSRSLSLGQRALYAIHWCVTDVCNGGFTQFYDNSTGLVATDAEAGMELIGALEYAALLLRARAIFPDAVVPRDREQRMDRLEAVDGASQELFGPLEETFYADLSTLYAKLADYVRTHPIEFVRAGAPDAV